MNSQLLLENAQLLVPYAILLLLFLALSMEGEFLRNRIADWGIIGLLLVFVGLREAITPDSIRYRDLYESIGSGGTVEIEPTFAALSRLLQFVGLDYHALFFCYAAIAIFCVYFAVRNFTGSAKTSLLYYVLIPSCLLNLFVEMREMAAVAIVFLALSLIKIQTRHRGLKIAFLACVSCMFHFSAAVFWIVFTVGWKFIRKKHSFSTQVVIIITSIFVPTSLLVSAINLVAYPILPGRYQAYIKAFLLVETNLAETGQLLKSVIYSSMAILFALWSSRQDEKESSEIPVNLFVLGVALLNVTRSFAEISRVSYFFLILQIVIFPMIFLRMKNRAQSLLAAYTVFLFYLAQFAWGLFYYSEEVSDYVFLHYRNVLFSP